MSQKAGPPAGGRVTQGRGGMAAFKRFAQFTINYMAERGWKVKFKADKDRWAWSFSKVPDGSPVLVIGLHADIAKAAGFALLKERGEAAPTANHAEQLLALAYREYRLADRVMARLAEKPELLDRLRERFESDDLVD